MNVRALHPRGGHSRRASRYKDEAGQNAGWGLILTAMFTPALKLGCFLGLMVFDLKVVETH